MSKDKYSQPAAYRGRDGALVVEGVGIKGQVPLVGKFDFSTWTYSKRVHEDGLSVLKPLSDDEADRVKINDGNWERVILDSALLTAHRVGNLYENAARDITPITTADIPGRIGEFFGRSFQLNKQMLNAQDAEESKVIDREKRNYLKRVAADVRANQRWDFVKDLSVFLKEGIKSEQVSGASVYFANMDVIAIHLLSGKHNRFLAGVDGKKAYWKNVEIPPVFRVTGAPIMHMVNPYFSYLDQVRSAELKAVPAKIIDPRDYKKISLREPQEGVRVSDMLKKVLQHQRFTMREGGISVVVGNAGDVNRMVVVESKGLIFAKGETPYGDLSAVLDKDEATGWFSDLMPEFVARYMSPEEMAAKSKFAVLVGEVYAEYLCGDVKTLTGERKGKQRAYGGPGHNYDRKRPLERVIIIDERTGDLVGQAERRPYTGKLVPDIVQYSGYVRARPGGASPETIRKAEAWHEETGLDLPVYDPLRQEAIPPGTRPPGAAAYIKDLPTYWKRELNETSFKPRKGFDPKYTQE